MKQLCDSIKSSTVTLDFPFQSFLHCLSVVPLTWFYPLKFGSTTIS